MSSGVHITKHSTFPSPKTGNLKNFSYKRALPPGLRLDSIADPVGSIPVGNAAHQAAKSVRPVGIGEEGTQHRSAEKLATCSNLWSDRKFTQPAVHPSIRDR